MQRLSPLPIQWWSLLSIHAVAEPVVFPMVETVVSAPYELVLHPTGTISDKEEPVRPRLLMRLPKSAGKGIRMSFVVGLIYPFRGL